MAGGSIDGTTARASTARVSIPAMPNAHSHAFQRALRGRAERPGRDRDDDFWTWRTEMFHLAETLDPDSMRRLAYDTYSEMAGAGYGVVGEFHYVHHQPDGTPYPDPNEMARTVAGAAVQAGLPIVLLPAAYHRGGWDGADLPPAPGQRRFCDPDVESFLHRVDELRHWAASVPGVEVGIAAHSVRAVPSDWLQAIAEYSESHRIVRHVHAHEQRRELEECQAEHGCSPIELLERTGFLGPPASVIHGIHVSRADIAIMARRGATIVTCPTTEGNLGDGYLPAMAYTEAGVPLAIGSDSQVRIDPFEEARELETGSRRERQLRAGLLASVGDLWEELCRNGYRSLGLGGELTEQATGGELAEQATGGEVLHGPPVEIDLEHPDLRGVDPVDLRLALVTCASAAIVTSRRGGA
jgi:formimidoylglutamate deiminase